jgi:hypothetical protein
MTPRFLVLAILILSCRLSIAADRVWIGPSPFVQVEHTPQSFSRELRPDFVSVLSDPDGWPTVRGKADVFKSYLMLLPETPLSGRTEPELTDADLRHLLGVVRGNDLNVAFETGGLRLRKALQGREDQAGEQQAESELRLLRRWLDAGGTIDYLTTDHPVMMNLRGLGFPGPGLDPNRSSKLTVEELTDELVDYFLAMKRKIPGVRFGTIESLGYFWVQGIDGDVYKATDPQLPRCDFEEFFDRLLEQMAKQDLKLDHFHIDFGYIGVAHDGRAEGTLDFGRILAVERYVQSRGVKAGVIFNAFHDRKSKNLTSEAASRQARERTLAFAEGYRKAGGNAEHLVVQTWHPYPDRTGPEGDPLTVLGVARDVLTCLGRE